MPQNYLSSILWLYIPLFFYATLFIMQIALPDRFMSTMYLEHGPIEILQAIVIFIGLVVCVRYFATNQMFKNKFYDIWFGLAGLCCLYVFGEELSWGQHIWNWATPDVWEVVNDQQETNLHNTSSWFDQKPRLILEIGIMLGPILTFFLNKKPLVQLSPSFKSVFPTKQMIFISLMVFAHKFTEKLFEVFDSSFFSRVSEIIEISLFYFVSIYLLNLYRMLRSMEKA